MFAKKPQKKPKKKLRPISEDGGPEVAEWNKIMEPYLGMNWLDTPWLYAEFYAYRRLMEAFSFFKTGEYKQPLSELWYSSTVMRCFFRYSCVATDGVAVICFPHLQWISSW